MVDLLTKAEEVAKELGMKEDGKVEEKEEAQTEEETQEAKTDETDETKEEESDEAPKSIPYKRFAEVYGRYKELERLTTALLADKQRETQPSREAPRAELPDFDAMTQGEVAKWTLSAVSQLMDQKLSRAVGPMQESAAVERATMDIKETAAKHTDFWKHYDTMHDLASKHPTLNAEQLYSLASGNKTALAKSVTDGLREKIQMKKNARTEMRSNSSGKQSEVTNYKNVREAAIAMANKLGLK
jgi:hypothetical protein